MNPTKLTALLKKAPTQAIELPEPVAQREPVAVLIFSFLLWEASTTQAVEAFRRIQESMVDFNDVRVSLPRELIDLLGPRYPRAEERARRMRASLNEVFKREHAVKFPLAEGKRDIKAYVESIEGMMVPYVATRLLLICFGVHGVPVDEQTRETLAEHGICEPGSDLAEIGGALARHVKAEQTEAAHAAIQSLVDAHHEAAQLRAPRRPVASAKPSPATHAAAPTHGAVHAPAVVESLSGAGKSAERAAQSSGHSSGPSAGPSSGPSSGARVGAKVPGGQQSGLPGRAPAQSAAPADSAAKSAAKLESQSGSASPPGGSTGGQRRERSAPKSSTKAPVDPRSAPAATDGKVEAGGRSGVHSAAAAPKSSAKAAAKPESSKQKSATKH